MTLKPDNRAIQPEKARDLEETTPVLRNIGGPKDKKVKDTYGSDDDSNSIAIPEELFDDIG